MKNDSAIEIINNNQKFNNLNVECFYRGTDFLDVKIYLIGVFAAFLAVISFFFNAFFTYIFIFNVSLRQSPLYYFGVLAVLDIIMAVNYLALMAVPVYMDQFKWLWLYYLFLLYLKPMLTLSNCALFASVLMIILATSERFLLTFQTQNLILLRRFVEKRRPQVCLCLILLAISYKICTYFEIDIIEYENCNKWAKYEIMLTELAKKPKYRFWWVFVARNLIDRIIPFFALVLMNFLIIKTLKREHKRSFNNVLPLSNATKFQPVPSKKSKTKSLKKKLRVRRNRNDSNDDNINKNNLKDATRALLAIVMMYLLSQTLQVLITFVEAFWKNALEEEYTQLYSFINDLMSILTLLSSALRFPVYCSISSPISQASNDTLRRLFGKSNKYSINQVITSSNAIRLLNNNNNQIDLNDCIITKKINNNNFSNTTLINSNNYRNNFYNNNNLISYNTSAPKNKLLSNNEWNNKKFNSQLVIKLVTFEDL